MTTIAKPATMLSWSLYNRPYKKSRAPTTIKNIRKKIFIILPVAGNGDLNPGYPVGLREKSPSV
jgi:hypothetical protein